MPSDTDGTLTAGDTDYFRMEVSAAGTLLVYTSGGTDTVGRLEDAGGTSLGEDDDSGSGLNFRMGRQVSAGTYYVAVRHISSSGAGSYTLHVRFTRDEVPESFDWIIYNFEVLRNDGVLDEPVEPGWQLGLGAAVQNIGSVAAPSTRVRYYQSGDSAISARDTEVAQDDVIPLDSGSLQGNAAIVLAPASPGTYYYGACVESVREEEDDSNNCSDGFEVVVRSSSDDDHGDDRASATGVAVPSDTDGTLTAGDTDYFRMEVSAAGTLLVYTSGGSDTGGRLEDASGTVLGEDDDSGSGFNFRIERQVSAGTYYVAVRRISGAGGRNYRLHVRFEESDDGEDDHGDDRASATRVAVPSDTDGTLTAGDTDYFRVEVSAAGALLVYTSGGTDTVGRLEDAGGTSLGEDDDSGSGLNFRMGRQVSAGTYYVAVRHISSSGAGNYRLHVRFDDGEDDHGDDRASATRVAVPSDTEGRLTADDADYFMVEVGSSGRLQVYTSGGTDTTGRLENASGASLGDDDDSGTRGNFRMERDVSAGTYYVRVRGRRSSTAGDYTLHVRFGGSGDDHGDDRASATAVAVPSDTDGELTLGDTDYFRMDVRGSGVLQVYSSGGTDTQGRLELANGDLVWADDNSGEGLNFRVAARGGRTFYIRVRGGSISTTGSYALHVRFDQSPDDHGNEFASATGVAVPSDTAGVLTEADIDYFRIEVSGYGRLQAYSSGDTNTGGFLWDGSGNRLAEDDDLGGSNFRIERYVSGGTYYIGVRGYTPLSTGSYTLHVRFDEDDHGNDRASATGVAVPSDTDGRLISGDTDYFTFEVSSAGRLEVYTSGGTDTLGWLEDSVGNRSGGNDDSGEGRNFRITKDVFGGTHYVRVRGGSRSTEGDYRLHVRFAASVGLSVGDSSAEEGKDAVLAFMVELDEASTTEVAVDYRTVDGSARAGADYTGASGRLVFDPGEVSMAVEVAVLDDAHDEAEETLTLRLSNASGAQLRDDEGTGVIRNEDPMPRALMARFGRTVAAQMVERVEERLAAPREPGFRGRLAGQELGSGIDGDAALGLLSGLAGFSGVEQAGVGGYGSMGGLPGGGAGSLGMLGSGGGVPLGVGGGFGGFGAMGSGLGLGAAVAMGGVVGSAGGLRGPGLQEMGRAGGNLVTGSALEINRANRYGGVLSVWSRGAQSHFGGGEGPLSLSGDVRTTTFGADYAAGRVVAGLSLSRSRGLGEYRGDAGGQVASSVTGLYPWLGYEATDRVTVWGVAGYGTGGLQLTPEGAPALESGLSMAMAAAGTRGELVAGGGGGFELAFKADALWVGTSTDNVDGPAGRLAATEAEVTRLRTGLEGSRDSKLAGRLSLRPSIEVGLRHDGDAAETGAGVDIGGGLMVSDPPTGLSVDVRVRMLLVHQADGFRERGVAVSLGYNPTPSTPLGFAARVAPSWGGEATGGAQALWGRETMLGSAHAAAAYGSRLDAEMGYGLPVGSRLVGTPRFSVGSSEYGRDYGFGYRLGLLERGTLNFDVGIDAHRRASPTADGADNGFIGRGTLGW